MARTAKRFEQTQMVTLDQVAKRYGRFPHELLHLPINEYTFNIRCAEAGIAEEGRQHEKAMALIKSKSK